MIMIFNEINIFKFYKAPIHIAAFNKYTNIAKILMSHPNIDINSKAILNIFLFFIVFDYVFFT